MRGVIDRSRRRFLFQAGACAGAWSATPSWLRAMEAGGMRAVPKIAPNKASPAFNPDVEIELVCRPDSVSILNGQATRVWRYFASLIKGPEGTLTALPTSYLGSVMRFSKGQKIRIRLRNELPEPTITHWHGLHVPMLMDGHPMYAIDPGETFVYEFEMLNRASMNIYHPHPHEATAPQVYRGLAGVILVNDEEERALELPSGEYEIPIVVQDRTFDEHNQLVYGGGMHGMHGQTFGFHGDRILVNGRPDHRIDVASRAYRLRILNGSNARIYKLAWDDGTPITIIGVDGGLLEKPESKPYVMLAPGERLDVWADFSGRAIGSQLVMRSRPFTGALPKMAERMMGGGGGMGMGGMGGGMMMGGGLPVGSDYPIFTIRVTKSTSDSPGLPERLSTIVRYRSSDIANPDNPTPIGISESPMSMLLNGRPYDHDDMLPSERVPVDTVQLMEIHHARGGGMGMMGGGMREMGGGMGMMGRMGMMMSMAHPIHLHGEYFQIVHREVDAEHAEDYATMRDGLVTSGWKDTVLVAPGETVRIVKPFHDFKGRFMFHCHILEHEDMGMMREFSVE
jgi:FtsP/CotA-like multicopper oxidase with cupredoxin domain